MRLAGVDVSVGYQGDGPQTGLMIHCALSHHQALLRLARMMGVGYRFTLFDLPGHGASAEWDGVADLQALSTQIAVELCAPGSHVIGHSFGGTVALRLAVERPDLVARLTLCEPVFFAAVRQEPAYAAYLERFAPYLKAMAAGDHAAAAAAFQSQWGESDWDQLPSFARAELTKRIALIAASLPAIEGDSGGVFAPGRLEQLRCPVTLIRGERTEPIMRHVHRAIMARISQATEVVITRAGHMAPLTHARAVAAALAG